ncbi:hypothetical protein K466DRAFT_604565 [Polyporus arcularius HHB13444]|uniref:Uncharacterized protein n=1 Tax=Polyporus arcularius HHB13444 TaxID=1314778 RepID=A0A5C3NV68_9APHY|nr:hypothetical protein K466DRAFT_604565 [Polyporus arcularius HHB13444]
MASPANIVLLKPRACNADEKKRQDAREDEPTLVFARWVGVGGRARAANAILVKSHIYSSSIPPERPLRIGMRIRILATTPASYSTAEEEGERYDTYDAHVVGVITGVVGWKGRKVVLEVRNECALNPVETVRIRLPFAPEVTVQLEAATIPMGRYEAQEADLNTHAVVRARIGDTRCGGSACWTPWRSLVGENFLLEPMEEDVGERPGIKPGRKKVPLSHFAGWGESAEAEKTGF